MKIKPQIQYELIDPMSISPNPPSILNRSVSMNPDRKNTNMDTEFYFRKHWYSPKHNEITEGNGPTFVSMDMKGNAMVVLSNMEINNAINSIVVSYHENNKEIPKWQKRIYSNVGSNVTGRKVFIDMDGRVVVWYNHQGRNGWMRLKKTDGDVLWATTMTWSGDGIMNDVAVGKNIFWCGGGNWSSGHTGGSGMMGRIDIDTGDILDNSFLWTGNHNNQNVFVEKYNHAVADDNGDVYFFGNYWYFVSLAGVAGASDIHKFDGQTGNSIWTSYFLRASKVEIFTDSNIAYNKDSDTICVLTRNTQNSSDRRINIINASNGALIFGTGWTPPGSIVGVCSNGESGSDAGFYIQIQSGSTLTLYNVLVNGDSDRTVSIVSGGLSTSISAGLAKQTITENDNNLIYFPFSAPITGNYYTGRPSTNNYWTSALPLRRTLNEMDLTEYYTEPENYGIKNMVSLERQDGTGSLSYFSSPMGYGMSFPTRPGLGYTQYNDLPSILSEDDQRIYRDTMSIVSRSYVV